MSGRFSSLSSLKFFSRTFSSNSTRSNFHVKNLKFERTTKPKTIPKITPPFGQCATDHMLEIDFRNGEWQQPVIKPFGPLAIDPMAKVLHYSPTCFEGMKAFRGKDGEIRLFRPDQNMARLLKSAKRSALPSFSPEQLGHMIEDLVRKDQDWVPSEKGTSLYIRPLIIGTDASLGIAKPTEAKLVVICCPVGPYYGSGWSPISMYATPSHIRAAPGGVGAFKMGCNYAPTIQLLDEAAKYGCQQSLWLWGEKQWITEAGTSNLFLLWKNTNNELELVTPPIDGGLILPGVTRDSILSLARELGEFKITERYPTMAEVREAADDNRILEFFGTGTAAVVAPCKQIVYAQKPGAEPIIIDIPEPKKGTKPLYQRMHESITGIQYGEIDRPEWVRIVN